MPVIEFSLNFLSPDVSREDIFKEIRRVDLIVGKKILTRADFDRHSKIHSSTLVRRFGDWWGILNESGIPEKYSGRMISGKMRTAKAKLLTDDEIIQELKRVASVNGGTITIGDLRANSNVISESIVRRRFGSWEAWIIKAELHLSTKYHRRISDEAYFENLLNVWTCHGRQPLRRELEELPSTITPNAYDNRFGNFRKALQSFVDFMGKNWGKIESFHKESQLDERVGLIKATAPSSDVRRGIGLALRYKVLSRDKFKCVRCGDNPATNPVCRLHVDHVVPFSKGGLTTMENLQTLCEGCNLWKGNRHYV